MTNARRAQRSLVATLVAALIIGLTAPVASAASLGPEKWAARFCGIAYDFSVDMDNLADDISGTTLFAEFDLATDPSNALGLSSDMADYADRGAKISSTAAKGFRKLPKADVEGGGDIKQALQKFVVPAIADLVPAFKDAASDFRANAKEKGSTATNASRYLSLSSEFSETLDAASDSIASAFQSLPDDPSVDPDGTLEQALLENSDCAAL